MAVLDLRGTLQRPTTTGSAAARHGTWSAQYEPSPALAVTVARSTLANGQRNGVASLRVAPLRWDGRFAMDGFFSSINGVGAPSQIGRVGISAMRNGVRVELFGSRTLLDGVASGTAPGGFRGNATGIEATAAPSWWRLPGVQRSWVTGSAERTMGGAVRGALRLDGSTARASFEIARYLSSGREPGRWAFTITPRSRNVRQTTTVVHTDAGADPTARSSVLHSMSGSMAWEAGRARVSLPADPAANRGTIIGRTFLDLDDDGLHDADEPMVPGVPVHVANRLLVTDAYGRFRSEQLTAAEMVQIVIDSTALPSPCWRPAAPRWRVRATEGGLAEVLLPLRAGGILEGRITRGGAGADSLQAGALPWNDMLHLRAVSVDGREVHDLDVFGAGTFYMLGMPFGSYDVSMPDDDQRRAGLQLAPARVVVARPPVVDGDTAGGGTCPITSVTLRARTRASTLRADSIPDALAPQVPDVSEARSPRTVIATPVVSQPAVHPSLDGSTDEHAASAAARTGRNSRSGAVPAPTRTGSHRRSARRTSRSHERVAVYVSSACSWLCRLELQTPCWSLLGCQHDDWRHGVGPVAGRSQVRIRIRGQP